MSKVYWLFYGTWAVVWITLVLASSTVLRSAAEAWFVTFPVAWTAALVVTRHRIFLYSVLKHPAYQILFGILWMINTAWSVWERGVRRDDLLLKTLAASLAIALTLVLIGLIATAINLWKQHGKTAKP